MLGSFVFFDNGVTNRITAQHPEQAEDAIAHMCFLTDAHRLYSHALGVYDLELTLLVAQQAQMVRLSDGDFCCVMTYHSQILRILANTYHSFVSFNSSQRLDVNLRSTITFHASKRLWGTCMLSMPTMRLAHMSSSMCCIRKPLSFTSTNQSNNGKSPSFMPIIYRTSRNTRTQQLVSELVVTQRDKMTAS